MGLAASWKLQTKLKFLGELRDKAHQKMAITVSCRADSKETESKFV